jgi:hypothetical protein
VRKILLPLIAVVAFVCSAQAQTIVAQGPNRVVAVWPALTATGSTAGLPVSFEPWVHTIQVVVTSSPGTCTAKLQGSLDGTNWFDLQTAQSCVTSGSMSAVSNFPVLWVRATLVTFSSGTVTFSYAGVH